MWGAILVISGRNCNWHLVRGSHGCWNTSTLCQIYRRTLQHYWMVLQGQKPCVVQSPEHWLLYHPGANESATSKDLHLELPACESWARGCVVLTRTLVILMHLCLRDTGRCDSFLFCFKIYIISCLPLSFLLPFWLVDRIWSQAFFHTPSLASLKTSLCGSLSNPLVPRRSLWEVVRVFWSFMFWSVGVGQHWALVYCHYSSLRMGRKW